MRLFIVSIATGIQHAMFTETSNSNCCYCFPLVNTPSRCRNNWITIYIQRNKAVSDSCINVLITGSCSVRPASNCGPLSSSSEVRIQCLAWMHKNIVKKKNICWKRPISPLHSVFFQLERFWLSVSWDHMSKLQLFINLS